MTRSVVRNPPKTNITQAVTTPARPVRPTVTSAIRPREFSGNDRSVTRTLHTKRCPATRVSRPTFLAPRPPTPKKRSIVSPTRRFALSPTPLFHLTLFLLLPVSLQAEPIPHYIANFELEEGFFPGPLDGQNGWYVERGDAYVVDDPGDVVVGEQALEIVPSGVPGIVVRDFERFADSEVVYVDYYTKGAAGPLPVSPPEDLNGASFFLTLVKESEGLGVFYFFDGEGWQRVSGAFVGLDSSGAMVGYMSVTARLDYGRGTWDLYLDGDLVAVNLPMAGDVVRFTRVVLHGHQERSVYIDAFYAGAENPLFDSVDGIDNSWKDQFGLDTDRDIRDEDPDGDGLTNLEEYFLGTNPVIADTSWDGLGDGEAVDLGVNPIVPGNRFRVRLPFTDDFESWPLGDIDARGGWRVYGLGQAEVEAEAGVRGTRILRLDAADGPVDVDIDVQGEGAEVVWTDFHLRPRRHTSDTPPEVAEDTAVALYFDLRGRAVAWDGAGGEWITFSVPASTVGRSVTSGDSWVRVTVRQDFSSQTWSLWLNGAKVADDLGFASERASLRHFALRQTDAQGSLDDVYIGTSRPYGLGDEVVFGSDRDSSGDGMSDADKLFWGLDPAAYDELLRPAAGFEGGVPGFEGYGEVFVGTGGQTRLWVSGRLSGNRGLLPDVSAIEGSRAVLVAVDPYGFVVGYDGAYRRWVNSGYRLAEGAVGVDIDLFLDYETGRWSLCVDGVLRLRDLGFRDRDLRTLTRLAMSEGAAMEGLTVSLEEPPGMDFSGDGMTNDEKRALGLDVYRTDTSGDGLPDWWLVAHGLDPLDPGTASRDESGDGNSNLLAYLLGVDPRVQAPALQAPWEPRGIGGDPVRSIGALQTQDGFRVTESGRPDPESGDEFAFVHRAVQGDFVFVARLNAFEVYRPERGDFLSARRLHDLEVRAPRTEAGITVRSSLASDGAMASLMVWRGGYISTIDRTSDGNAVLHHHRSLTHVPDTWLKLERYGNRVIQSISRDGEHWLRVGERAIVFGEEVYVGLATASRMQGRPVVAEFTDVSLEVFDPSTADDTYVGADPYPAPLWDPSMGEVSTLSSVAGAGIVGQTGTWRVDGNSIYALSTRGSVDYVITLPEEGLFRLEIEGRQYNRHSAYDSFDLAVSIDGMEVGRPRLRAPLGSSGKGYVFLPWLPAGSYTVRVEWINGADNTQLQIFGLRLQALGGTDRNGSGIADWIEDHFDRHTAFNEYPHTTYVSPFFAEGRSVFPDLLLVEAFAGEGEDAVRMAASNSGDGGEGGILIERGLTGFWYADVPLDENGPTIVRVAEQGGVWMYEKEVTWEAFNLLEEREDNEVLLRVGEALRLTADPGDDADVAVSIVVADLKDLDDAEYYDTFVSVPVVHNFEEVGEYVVAAEAGDEGEYTGEILVRVVAATFGAPPVAMIGNPREWRVPGLPAEATVEYDHHLTLREESVPGDSSREFVIGALSLREGRVLARLGGGGARPGCGDCQPVPQ